MKIVTVIPARYDSKRFPGKPLVDIAGKSMIKRVYEKCREVIDNTDLYVATDSQLIYQHCIDNNMNVVMTSSNCLTGTDRIAEFSLKIKADYYINVQGDEPVIDSQDILKIKESILKHPSKIINGYCAIKSEETFRSLTMPKVVFREDERLLYMSRSPIPGNKNDQFNIGFRQVCIYAFPYKSLEDFYKCKAKTRFESQEDIEILRFLELGFDVQMVLLSDTSIPVDTPEDLQKVINYVNKIER
ncbi:3-deoxy-manno-octulosonate cytidylyltransferase [Winogradskyella luteola]|uniref:3-deoxy-manno-octulosonate cytidylyltransferase n=1 Tax=Winogradskyella luteola TaxID=2828330 RepID=A0A9X1F8H8_9FLAO|nr:3-deoxy-manno-octulosonate cytidylyltransferase [Winogradskyella luteola]MBV7268558.1 3-deoxy-manno-octulosonate cytidylyltransferase [Winogradskyella luteola]